VDNFSGDSRGLRQFARNLSESGIRIALIIRQIRASIAGTGHVDNFMLRYGLDDAWFCGQHTCCTEDSHKQYQTSAEYLTIFGKLGFAV
jgi:hypothetical protein